MTTKQEIINQAIALFNKRGFEGATTFEISKNCDVTQPLVFYHYKSKADLFISCCNYLYDNMYDNPNNVITLRKLLLPEVVKNSELLTKVIASNSGINEIVRFIDSVLLNHFGIESEE